MKTWVWINRCEGKSLLVLVNFHISTTGILYDSLVPQWSSSNMCFPQLTGTYKVLHACCGTLHPHHEIIVLIAVP